MKYLIHLKPTYKQHLAYTLLRDDITSFILFGGGAEGGKSWLGAEWLLSNCYLYPGSKWFIGRNERTRLMASSYQTFLKVCEKHKIDRNHPVYGWSLNGKYNYIQFKNGSLIDLLDLKLLPTDPMFQRYGSTEYTGGWIEEAGEVHFMAFDVLKSRIGRWKNNEFGLNPPKLLLTCNPEQNWLYRVFYKPSRKDELPDDYAFVQSLYSDNPYTAQEAGKRLDRITDPVLRARLKLGQWEYSMSSNSLVSYDEVMDLFTNTVDQKKDELGRPLTSDRFFTADVARYGSDKIVFGNWQGFNLYKVQWKKDRGIDQTSLDIKQELQSERIPYSHAIADDDGVGGGVVDNNRGMKGFVGNASALERKDPIRGVERDNYGNIRSQCGFMLAEYIRDHRIAISAPIEERVKEWIIEDLQALLRKKESTVEAPLRLISKDEIKEILGRSPDFADMMMMRMYFELDKPMTFTQNNDPGGVQPFIEGTLA